MPEEQLREELERLHEDLEQAPALDQETRDLLRLVMADIHKLLGRDTRASEEEHASIAGRLQNATRRFEDSHPGLTAGVGKILDLMGRTFP
jgi:seryl-tRNA synthetase